MPFMADVEALKSLLRQGRPAPLRLVDPTTRNVVEVPVVAAPLRWHPGAT